MAPGSQKLLALVLATGVAVPGVLNYWLSASGFDTLGSVVWTLGYGTVVVVVWYGWIRPLDLTGPGGDEDIWPTDDDTSE